MARNGPSLDQRVVVFQGSEGVVYTIPVSDPPASPTDPVGPPSDLNGASATWWVGPLPVVRPGIPLANVANAPGSRSKSLAIEPDPDRPGGYRVVLAILDADVAGLAPGGLWQHEVWIDQRGKSEPVTIGPLILLGTVKGASV
jgi:hypothetical protein